MKLNNQILERYTYASYEGGFDAIMKSIEWDWEQRYSNCKIGDMSVFYAYGTYHAAVVFEVLEELDAIAKTA